MARLRNRTPKRAAIDRLADKWRKGQINAVGRCEWCGRPKKPNELTVHEICGGCDRWRSQDKAYASLVVCRQAGSCHQAVQIMSKPRQLAILHIRRLGDFDLVAYNEIPNRQVCWKDVMEEIEKLSLLDNFKAEG